MNVGFSLDAELDYPALAADIERFAELQSGSVRTSDPAFAALVSSHRADLHAAAERLKTRHDLRPFLALRRRYVGSHQAAKVRFNATLQYIETMRAYQTARYDGNLQGTSVGMILFYTDLLAKLWALDYQGMAPKHTIRGFRAMQEIKVPKLYWDDFVRLSKTRLWFGLRQEGFEVYGDKILFQPVATRVYAASSDPLQPGRESRPNYQSGEFLGWWDRHYATIAAAEPYYHKLDQIQKWSCLFMVLKENKTQHLDFLGSVPVARDMDFASWSKSGTDMAKVSIPFLDRHKYGRTTECLPLLSSQDYPLMGRYFALSGGVSLASRQDILAKMHKHGTSGSEKLDLAWNDRPTGGESPTAAGRAARGLPAGHPIPAGAAARQAQGLRPQKPANAATAPPARSAKRRPASATGTSIRRSGEDYGTFTAEKRPGAIALKWKKGPAMALHDLVASLAALQEANSHALKGEAIFSSVADIRAVVRVKEGQVYLVKTVASDNEWLYLSVNPTQVADYPARAAAAFPEADIFCARLVSDAHARKLAAGKPVVR
jgi:hypothetical protein